MQHLLGQLSAANAISRPQTGKTSEREREANMSAVCTNNTSVHVLDGSASNLFSYL
jgi:hypothetical protein